MSFREKCAWISFVLLVLLAVGVVLPEHIDGIRGLHYFLSLLLGFVLLQVLLRLIIALQAPKDARTPKDERERLLDLKATRLAAYVFVLGTFVAIMMPHWGATGFAVTLYVVLAFVVAEVVNYTARIIYYRRG